jgi:hypothetical protein
VRSSTLGCATRFTAIVVPLHRFDVVVGCRRPLLLCR